MPSTRSAVEAEAVDEGLVHTALTAGGDVALVGFENRLRLGDEPVRSSGEQVILLGGGQCGAL
jgi:hypothetical protein